MTRDEVRRAVLESLSSIAPEIDTASLEPDAPLREACDLDSMDFLNFVIGVHKRLQVDVPEADYPKLATLNGAVEYLTARL